MECVKAVHNIIINNIVVIGCERSNICMIVSMNLVDQTLIEYFRLSCFV